MSLLPAFLANLAQTTLAMHSAAFPHQQYAEQPVAPPDSDPPLSCLLFAMCCPALGVRQPPAEPAEGPPTAGSDAAQYAAQLAAQHSAAQHVQKVDTLGGAVSASTDDLIGAVHAATGEGHREGPPLPDRAALDRENACMQGATGSGSEGLRAAGSPDAQPQLPQSPVVFPEAAVRMDVTIERGIELWTPEKEAGLPAGSDCDSGSDSEAAAAAAADGSVHSLADMPGVDDGAEQSLQDAGASHVETAIDDGTAGVQSDREAEQDAPLVAEPGTSEVEQAVVADEGQRTSQRMRWRARFSRAVGRVLKPKGSTAVPAQPAPAMHSKGKACIDNVVEAGTAQTSQAASVPSNQSAAPSVASEQGSGHGDATPRGSAASFSGAVSLSDAAPEQPGSSRDQQQGAAAEARGAGAASRRPRALRSKLSRLAGGAKRAAQSAKSGIIVRRHGGQGSDAAAWPELEEVCWMFTLIHAHD